MLTHVFDRERIGRLHELFEYRHMANTAMMAAMTPDQALLLLGLDESSTWAEIRRAYRARIRQAHPDAGGSFETAASLNDAMAVLTHTFSSRVDNELVLVDDELVLVAPKREVFDRLHAALAAVAEVVAIDSET